jgi:enediyne polyketide synthase
LEELLPEAASPYRDAGDLSAGDVPASLVQLSIVTASLAGLKAMAALGIDANFGVGHSVGELTALHWAHVIDEQGVLELARRRGEVMTEHATETGAMANIEAEDQVFSGIVDGAEVTVACFNSPRNRVVSGTEEAVNTVVERAREHADARALRLQVVGAFHSPLMNEAAPVFERVLAEQAFGSLQKPVFSTVSGSRIAEGDDVAGLLSRQVTEPVLFLNAVLAAVDGADLLIEVGPGRMLSGLVSEFSPVPAIPIRVGHASAQGLLAAAGAAWVLGADVHFDRLPAA